MDAFEKIHQAGGARAYVEAQPPTLKGPQLPEPPADWLGVAQAPRRIYVNQAAPPANLPRLDGYLAGLQNSIIAEYGKQVFKDYISA